MLVGGASSEEHPDAAKSIAPSRIDNLILIFGV